MSPASAPRPLQTAGGSNVQITITVDLDINGATGERVTSHDHKPTSGTGFSYPRSPSRAKTIPAVSLANHPSEDSRQPQRRSSLSLEGRSNDVEYKEPQRQVEELKSEVETLQLQVQECHRGRERWTAETEKLRIDNLQREADATIREVERRAGCTANATPPQNNPRNPEVEQERIHPVPTPSPSKQQGESTRQQQSPSSSPSLHGRYARYSTCEPGLGYAVGSTYNAPSPVPPVFNSQQVSWIQPRSWGEDSYISAGLSFHIRAAKAQSPQIPTCIDHPSMLCPTGQHSMDIWNLSSNLSIHPSVQPLTYTIMGSFHTHKELWYLIRNQGSLNFCRLHPIHTSKGIYLTYIVRSHHSSRTSVRWVMPVKVPTVYHRTQCMAAKVTIRAGRPGPHLNEIQRSITLPGDSIHACTSNTKHVWVSTYQDTAFSTRMAWWGFGPDMDHGNGACSSSDLDVSSFWVHRRIIRSFQGLNGGKFNHRWISKLTLVSCIQENIWV